MKVKRTGKSKYGWYLMAEDNSFTSCSEEVSNFLKNQCPCEIKVESQEGEGKNLKVTRVSVISSEKSSQNGSKAQITATETIVREIKEKANSYTFGKADARAKVYFETIEDLQAQINALVEAGLVDNPAIVKIE